MLEGVVALAVVWFGWCALPATTLGYGTLAQGAVAAIILSALALLEVRALLEPREAIGHPVG